MSIKVVDIDIAKNLLKLRSSLSTQNNYPH